MLAVSSAVVVATVARRAVTEALWVGPASAKTALTRVVMFLRVEAHGNARAGGGVLGQSVSGAGWDKGETYLAASSPIL